MLMSCMRDSEVYKVTKLKLWTDITIMKEAGDGKMLTENERQSNNGESRVSRSDPCNIIG